MIQPARWLVDEGVAPAVTYGPTTKASLTGGLRWRLDAGEGHAFELRGPDDELMGEGRIVYLSVFEVGTEPLDDYAGPVLGATTIWYRQTDAHGKPVWVTP
jgi:hypothetical protein